MRAAQGGTILIDNVDRLDLLSQQVLCQILARRSVQPAPQREVPVDVRVVATALDGLESAVRDGKFSSDLFFRLNKVVINTTGLDQRVEDVASLANHFAAKATFERGWPLVHLTDEAIDRLERHTWPGNARQLHEVIEEAVLTCDGEVIRAADLPLDVTCGAERRRRPTWQTLADIEAQHIRQTLIASDWDLYRAAELLGIHVKHLKQKLSQHNIACTK